MLTCSMRTFESPCGTPPRCRRVDRGSAREATNGARRLAGPPKPGVEHARSLSLVGVDVVDLAQLLLTRPAAAALPGLDRRRWLAAQVALAPRRPARVETEIVRTDAETATPASKLDGGIPTTTYVPRGFRRSWIEIHVLSYVASRRSAAGHGRRVEFRHHRTVPETLPLNHSPGPRQVSRLAELHQFRAVGVVACGRRVAHRRVEHQPPPAGGQPGRPGSDLDPAPVTRGFRPGKKRWEGGSQVSGRRPLLVSLSGAEI